MVVNGREYPFWSQIVERKKEWIGNKLQDLEVVGPRPLETIVTDIQLTPNGDDSAMFRIQGEDFNCGFDVQYGGVSAGEDGWITFADTHMGLFRIQNNKESINGKST